MENIFSLHSSLKHNVNQLKGWSSVQRDVSFDGNSFVVKHDTATSGEYITKFGNVNRGLIFVRTATTSGQEYPTIMLIRHATGWAVPVYPYGNYALYLTPSSISFYDSTGTAAGSLSMSSTTENITAFPQTNKDFDVRITTDGKAFRILSDASTATASITKAGYLSCLGANFGKSETQGFVVENDSSFPGTPGNYQLFIRSDEGKAYFYNSGLATPAWQELAGGVSDHTALSNIGTYTHDQIDSHIGDSTIHFTQASIDHGSIAGLSDDDHAQYCHLTKDSQVLATSNIQDPALLFKNTATSGLKSGIEVGTDTEELSATATGGDVDYITATEIGSLADSGFFDGFIVEITSGTYIGERRVIIKTVKASNRIDVTPNFSGAITNGTTFKVYSRSFVSLTSRGTSPNFTPSNFMRGLHLTGTRNTPPLIIWEWYGKGIEIRSTYSIVTELKSGTLWTNATTLSLEGAPIKVTDGALHLAERTTPTAIENYGALYFKSDNKIYAQDGDGIEHEVAFV